jgi:hypothetical protein
METALIAFGGVALGWVLAAGTQLLRDRRQAEIALMLVNSELIGNIAQLDLARRPSGDEGEVHLSHWYKRWKLSRAAYDQQGALALMRLDAEGVAKVQDGYHALDAAELLLEEAREGVTAVRGADLSAPENAEAVARLVEFDATSRAKLRIQLNALVEAQRVVNRALPAKRRLKGELTLEDSGT